MEFLIVPVVFGGALLLLSLGKFIGKEKELHTCKGGSEAGACGSCSTEEIKMNSAVDDAGLSNVAQLGNPKRPKRFIDKLDFRPERFN